MKIRILATASAASLMAFGAPFAMAHAQVSDSPQDSATEETSEDTARQDTVYVTATRREQSLQDVPLSVTAYQQEVLSEKGIVSYEGLARETPGIVLNQPTANFNTITSRGIATNGYNANLQASTAIYINELPISSNGNSTILDPTLFDVERVEVLRGPQGTLFGANSLAGAVRILTKAPNASKFEAAGLVDYGMVDGDALRQRYNAMVNVPLVKDELALRLVGFYRDEDGWVDNLGTGVEGSNSFISAGGRAHLLWQPTSDFDLGLLVIHENNRPADSSLTNPARGEYVRFTDRPDLFQSEFTSYNLTGNYDFGFADFTSSSTYSKIDGKFIVDLAGTFAQAIPFGLDAVGHDENFVQEARLSSADGGDWDWIVGGFYFNKRRDIDYDYRSSLDFLTARGLTGLPNEYYQSFTGYFDLIETAAFGELTYRFSDQLWATGGLRYTETSVQSFTNGGGYNSNYLAAALGGFSNIPLTIVPVVAVAGRKVDADNISYKGSLSFKPIDNLTTYASISTGFRSPVANARAGSVSLLDPTDIVIPNGADSDGLTNYEVGLKGVFMNGKLTSNLAAYYIVWKDIQVQANRLSDQVQFATNIGEAVSQGLEFEVGMYPGGGLSVFLNGSLSDTEITELSAAEAAISGAELGLQLAMPSFQGAATARYDFDVADMDAFVSGTAAYVGDFPAMFPNVPGRPTLPAPTFDYTEAYTVVNVQTGLSKDNWKLVGYVENLFDDSSITYVHPEGFLDSRYARVRPQTVGVRLSVEY